MWRWALARNICSCMRTSVAECGTMEVVLRLIANTLGTELELNWHPLLQSSSEICGVSRGWIQKRGTLLSATCVAESLYSLWIPPSSHPLPLPNARLPLSDSRLRLHHSSLLCRGTCNRPITSSQHVAIPVANMRHGTHRITNDSDSAIRRQLWKIRLRCGSQWGS